MRSLRLFFFFLVIGVILASRAASFLVVDKPAASDVIVVLAGETNARPALALRLLRGSVGTRLLIDVEVEDQIYDQKLTAIVQKYIGTLPEANRITVCAIQGRSTVAETADVARCLQPLQAHSVLIVTSDYHTRRALEIFSNRLPQYEWSIAAAHNSLQFGPSWWTHREWAKITLEEWAKLIWWEIVDRWK